MALQGIFRRPSGAGNAPQFPVAVVGAGESAARLVRTMAKNANSIRRPLFFISRGEASGPELEGLPVYEGAHAENMLRKHGVREVILAVPDAESAELMELYNEYTALECKVRVGDPETGRVRDFSIEDLMFHHPVAIDESAALEFYRGKTVLITGGGGVIGSELCRQLARFRPAQLVVLDVSESNVYALQQNLRLLYGANLNFRAVLGSVRDRHCLDEVFRLYQPQVVFHAAANNNVSLMEENAAEAIKNNVFGMRNAADYAEAYGAEKFILLSADKAVNPTSILGGAKRMGELLIHSRFQSETVFAAVRFGNILDSPDGVIPLFRRQIEHGGPVTITDRRAFRFFISLADAVRLIIDAGVIAQPGDLLVFGTGKPLNIYELAVNMISLAGFSPEGDVAVQEIGLRPGEKLEEELLVAPGNVQTTSNARIWREQEPPFRPNEIEVKVTVLSDAVANHSDIHAAMRHVIPTYQG